MSQFHEDIREILNDVYDFLSKTLQHESISATTVSGKKKLLGKIFSLNQRYPQLQLSFESIPIVRQSESSDSKNNGTSYIDMNGCLSTPGSRFSVGDDFEKYGFLEKKGKEHLGGLISTSQKRWYGVKNGLLYYYSKSSDEVQKGTIPLSGYEVEVIKDNKKSYCFQITCPGRRTYQFVALSAEDLDQWVAAIERHSKGNENSLSESETVTNQRYQLTTSCNNSEELYEIVGDEANVSTSAEEIPQDMPTQGVPKKNGSVIPQDTIRAVGNESYLWDHQQFYVGLWDCIANDGNELNFLRGDIIRIISKEYDEYSWWIGELNGKIGFVPKSYLMEAYEVQ